MKLGFAEISFAKFFKLVKGRLRQCPLNFHQFPSFVAVVAVVAIGAVGAMISMGADGARGPVVSRKEEILFGPTPPLEKGSLPD